MGKKIGGATEQKFHNIGQDHAARGIGYNPPNPIAISDRDSEENQAYEAGQNNFRQQKEENRKR